MTRTFPQDSTLLPGETPLRSTTHPPRHFSDTPSAVEQLRRLTHAATDEEIGQHGPSMAALALTPDANPYLRLYEAIFGRDSLRVARTLVHLYPELTRTTLLTLASYQGLIYNTEREEEPGRIAHEIREDDDPRAHELTATRGWDWPYYGAVDATPEFIRTLAAYCREIDNPREFLESTYQDLHGGTQPVHHALMLALDWIASRRSANPEGLLEYQTPLPGGLENQVWKDSWDAYHHSDGAVANHAQGIASLEVQVGVYDALCDAADIYEQFLDNHEYATQLREDADALRQTILDLFWTDDKGGYFVLGTDRDDTGALRQLAIRTSNMGHALNSRLLEGNGADLVAKREAIARQLRSPELLCASGIRTLASDELRYRPGSYHNGSCWPWDTHYIATGLRRHGFTTQADDLDQKLLAIVDTTHQFPEYVRGDGDTPAINTRTVFVWDERYARENRIEQPPQEVQAWTVSAILEVESRAK